ncbi:hypothetical protein, partial [Profundibacterium mesophilum]|uniref:hypothetical protein n=1 Tax=Profundibacterium mesophilum TaxID=1258573 RepID=UPI001F48DAD9
RLSAAGEGVSKTTQQNPQADSNRKREVFDHTAVIAHEFGVIEPRGRGQHAETIGAYILN